jgi:hypothetical protein
MFVSGVPGTLCASGNEGDRYGEEPGKAVLVKTFNNYRVPQLNEHNSHLTPDDFVLFAASILSTNTQQRCAFWHWSTSANTRGSGWISCKLLMLLVRERGFEPPTPWSRTRFCGSLKCVEIE